MDQEKEDQKLSEESGANPTTPEELPDLEYLTMKALTLGKELKPERIRNHLKPWTPSLANLHEDMFLPPKSPRIKKPRPQPAKVPEDPLTTLDREKLMEKQRDDQSLKDHWTNAENQTGDYLIEKGILHHRSTGPLGDSD